MAACNHKEVDGPHGLTRLKSFHLGGILLAKPLEHFWSSGDLHSQIIRVLQYARSPSWSSSWAGWTSHRPSYFQWSFRLLPASQHYVRSLLIPLCLKLTDNRSLPRVHPVTTPHFIQPMITISVWRIVYLPPGQSIIFDTCLPVFI